jgi:putative transposase
MSRPLRIEYPNAFYHVMNRGRRREKIFFNDDDRYLFLSILAESVKLFNIKIYAYCLMSNHYHLLVSTPDANLARAMRHINGLFTQGVNRRHKLEGSVFKGRYKSVLIDESECFERCVRYIHRNPIKAGLEKELGEYPWSSHNGYLTPRKRLDWLCVDEALSFFGDREKAARSNYECYVAESSVDAFEKRLDGINWPSVLGTEAFKEKVKDLILGKNLKNIPSVSVKTALPATSMDEAMRLFDDNIKRDSDDGRRYLVRAFTIRYCREKLSYTNTQIASQLGVSPETVSRCYRSVRGSREYDNAMLKIQT